MIPFATILLIRRSFFRETLRDPKEEAMEDAMELRFAWLTSTCLHGAFEEVRR